MQCEECDGIVERRKATPKAPFRYDLSGVPNVYLAGMSYNHCERCGLDSPVLPKPAELHLLIAETLLYKPSLLNGFELRFLRKFAGLAAKKFARLLRIDAAHLSRTENGHYDSLGSSTDKLARVVASDVFGSAVTHDILTDSEDQLSGGYRDDPPTRFVFAYADGSWSTIEGPRVPRELLESGAEPTPPPRRI